MNLSGLYKFSHGINCLVPVILLTAQQVIAQNHDEGAEKSLSSGMSVALIFFISIFFLTGFASLYIRQCNNRRRRRANGVTTTTIFSRSPSLPRGRGLDQAVINTFPTFLYSQVKDHMIGQRVLECAVCLLEFEDNEILRLLPKCSHAFHPNCIDAWLAFRVTCPVCRANLVPKPSQLINNATTMVNNDLDNQLTSPPGNGSDTDTNANTGTDTSSRSGDLVIDISDYTATFPELIDTHMPNQSRQPPRSTSRRSKSVGNFVNKFRRSHSTGHIFQQEENRERFTLRLPEDVRSQLMKRSPGCSSRVAGVFLSVRSPRNGYRSSSVGTSRGKNYERFDSTGRSGVRNFRMTPPSLYQASSVRSAGGDDLMVMRSIKSPLDRLLRGRNKEDDGGERSNRRLIPDAQV